MPARIDGEGAVPVRGGQHVESSERGDAGIADHDIDSPVRQECCGEGTFDAPFVADIEPHGERPPESIFLDDDVRDFGCQRLVDVAHHDVRPLLGEALGHCPPDATRRARHDGDLSGEVFLLRQQREFVQLQRPVLGVERVMVVQRLVPARRFRRLDDPHGVAIDVVHDSRGSRVLAGRPHADARHKHDARIRIEHGELAGMRVEVCSIALDVAPECRGDILAGSSEEGTPFRVQQMIGCCRAGLGDLCRIIPIEKAQNVVAGVEFEDDRALAA